MNTLRSLKFFFRATGLCLAAACATLPPTGTPPASPDLSGVYTQAAQTVVAGLTQTAVWSEPESLTPAVLSPVPTLTVMPATTQTIPPSEIIPTFTPDLPTATPSPTNTLAPPSPTPFPCLRAQFLGDQSWEEDMIFSAGAPFWKAWQVRNDGSCAWTAGYALVFLNGDRMSGQRVLPINQTVLPGDWVELSVALVAPLEPGTYRGNWILQSDQGDQFGIGETGSEPLRVPIRVAEPDSQTGYNFAINYCSAAWSSAAGELSCAMDIGDSSGFVSYLADPSLEDRMEDEPALWMRPNRQPDGWIQGIYPPYRVRTGDRFQARVGCLSGSDECEVLFQLSYLRPNGREQVLDEWSEGYDGYVTYVDQDLNFLVGEQVRFILRVYNEGKASEADAFWFVPAIRKESGDDAADEAVQAARQQVAYGASFNISQMSVVAVEAVRWPDGCLGIQMPGSACSPGSVPGYRITLQAGGRRFEAHTDARGFTVYWFEI